MGFIQRIFSMPTKTSKDVAGGQSKTEVVVLVRFSLISASAGGAWKGQRISSEFDSHIARILDADRLRTRCDIFFNYSVPLLLLAIDRHQDININILVHASSMLPPDILDRLASLRELGECFDVKFFDVDYDYRMDNEVAEFMRGEVESHDGRDVVVPVMRLDDDDLLSPYYFDLLKKYSDFSFAGYTFHSPRGYEGLYSEGRFLAYSEMDSPKTGIGLAHMAIWSHRKKKFTSRFVFPPGPHINTDKMAPVILDGSMGVIFRTKHSHNDARSTKDGYSISTTEELDRKFFGKKIEPSNADLLLNFPSLK